MSGPASWIPGTRLKVRISRGAGQDRWSLIDANCNFFIDGLEPGEYAVSIDDGKVILLETDNVIVNKDSETLISLSLQADSNKTTD